MVSPVRLERTTNSLRGYCSTVELRTPKKVGTPGWNRTINLHLRRVPLYPLSYWGVVPSTGVGHEYFSVEKFRDPASAPSRLRLSTPVTLCLHIFAQSKYLVKFMVPSTGVEPVTSWSEARRSIH